ncbi:Protein of unknown function, partial [Cotesia congregata]
MSDYLRHKGKFAKKKVLDNNIKKVINIKRGKEERDKIVNPHSKVDEICPGRRIVELSTLAKNLKCKNCQGLLSLENVINEKRVGLNSILAILSVLGTVHAGMGCTALNKLLACLNIPTISSTLFKRYEREIGPALEERARESCKQAAEEERQLVIDNIINLSKELPPEIVQEIYLFMTDLQASNAENISSLDCNNNTTVYNPAKFDLAVGQIVNIILSYDMGWSKRGNGRSYDSLNVSQNKGNAAQLADALRQIPDHAFGNHENCDAGLYNKLKQIFIKYANNAAKFSIAASSQANESVNNIMAHKAPENRCYSLSESADFRLASTVCTKNDGDGHLLDVMLKLNVSPGQKREFAEKKENTEGINYQSNCGFDIDSEKTNFALEPQFLETLQSTQQNLVNQEDFTIVYFDLETSGFEKNADILQIAAKFKDYSFSLYAIPTKKINPSASKVTGLHQKCGTLYLRDKEIEAITLKDALLSFQEFLNISCKPCLLVAHNAAFDTPGGFGFT